MDKRNIRVEVFMDLEKTFDTVDHAILIKKLARYGVRSYKKIPRVRFHMWN